jgi:hypothetical protein
VSRRAGPVAGRIAAVLVSLAGLTGCVAGGQAPPAAVGADERCGHFRFAAEGERALFAGAVSQTRAAGRRPGTGPVLSVGRLYALRLRPFPAVRLAGAPFVDPGPGSYAGLARFTVPATGRYRVAAGGAVWLDVVVAGEARRALAFSGSPGCFAPHKIVVFELAAGEAVAVQVTGSGRDTVRLAVTAER